MNIIEYADREMLAMNVANVLAGSLKNHLSGNERATFAVPGGSTPGPVFEMLSATALDWSRVRIILTDERWVAEDDSQSNARLVRRQLLTDHAAAAEFLPYYQAESDAEQGAAQASAALADHLPISVLMLGMGADMHTASLFPGAPGLDAALSPDAPPLCAVHPAGHDAARVSLAAHVLDGALSKHLVFFGQDKRDALALAGTLDPARAPVAAVLDDIQVHWAA